MIADRELWVSTGGVLLAGPSELEGAKCLAGIGQDLSVRAQLLYGLELVDGRVEQTGPYNPAFLPTEEDYGDVPIGHEQQ